MKKWGMVLLISGLLLFCKRSEGQVSTYVFTASSGTYTYLSGGTAVDIIEDDDVYSSVLPIGFNFVFDGVTYTQVIASSNGWLSFNPGVDISGITNNLATSSTTIRPLLAPLWDDLDGFDGPGQSSYQVSGSSPNRVFTFEWRNWEWQYDADVPVISFQVKLYETTNTIQFIYQDEGGATSFPSASIGIAGAATGSGNFLSLNNTSASPTASSVSETTTLSSKPATGQVYQFAPPVCSGTPTGGTTASTANPACNGTPFTLSVSGGTSGYSGLTYQWQSSPDGTTWTNIVGATSTTYTTSISTSTYFRRTITCSGNSSNSSNLQVVIQTPTTSATPASVCVNSSSVLTASASASSGTIFSENFESGLQMTVVNGSPHTAGTEWTLQTSPYTYSGTSTFTFQSPGNNKFMLANSDAGGVSSSTNTRLTSSVINVSGYSTLSLSFNHYYHFYTGDQGAVEVSTNGGSSWTPVATYITDQGSSTSFTSAAINLNTYAGSASFMFRFNYSATWDWFWAIDDVVLSGTPSTVTYAWTASPPAGAGLPAGAGTLSAANSSITVTPTSVGNFTYTVSTNNSCLGTASVVVASTTGALVTSTTCLSQIVSTGDNYFVNGTCDLLAKIVPQGAGPAISGSVNVCARIESGTLFYNSEPYLMRHFDIEPASNASTATAKITLYVLQSEFDDYNPITLFPDLPTVPGDLTGIANLRITQCHGTYSTQPLPGYYSGSAVLINPADGDIVWNAAKSWWEISFDVTGFSGFFIHTTISGYPLSAQFISLTGKREEAINLLKWKVPFEQNIRGYEVERSYDGQNFSSIGFVNSLAPGGNSANALQYYFTDNNFTGDKQYYRLKQTGLDGRIKMSPVVLIKSSMPALLTLSGVFPNPAGHFVNLMIESPVRNEFTVHLTDINGKLLQTKKIIAEQGTTVIPFNTEQLAGGTYLLKVICGNGCENAVRKFVKQ
jgi:hypothetical protein